MKTLFAILTLVACSFSALLWGSDEQAYAQTAFQAPFDSQVWGPSWNCTTDGTANIDVQGAVGDSSGNYYGIGYFSSFRCVLRVHSGRGGAVQELSACADVVWDQNGLIVSVTPFAKGTGANGFLIPCTP